VTAVGEGLVSCSIRKRTAQLSYGVHYSLYRTLKVAAKAAVAERCCSSGSSVVSGNCKNQHVERCATRPLLNRQTAGYNVTASLKQNKTDSVINTINHTTRFFKASARLKLMTWQHHSVQGKGQQMYFLGILRHKEGPTHLGITT